MENEIRSFVALSPEEIDLNDCREKIRSSENGAECHFVGTVRNKTGIREVIRLEFEAYEPMAVSEINTLIEKAHKLFEISSALVHHRLGVVNPEETAVLIIVTSPHRDAAFVACRFLIDELKKSVPIWKKEVYADGEVWVSAHP